MHAFRADLHEQTRINCNQTRLDNGGSYSIEASGALLDSRALKMHNLKSFWRPKGGFKQTPLAYGPNK